MKVKDDLWENVDRIPDCIVTYLLYKEGKSIQTISTIRRMDTQQVEKDIIKSKMMLNKREIKGEDILLKIISMKKKDRLEYLATLNEDDKKILAEDISKRYFKFKNTEDKIILIWLIGELKMKELVPFLRMELNSNVVNNRRLACSALGKIKAKESKPWLEAALNDDNPQVRQYAVKALSHVGDEETIDKLELLLKTESKDYVIKAVYDSIEEIKNQNKTY